MSSSLIIFLTAEWMMYNFIFTMDESARRGLMASNHRSQFLLCFSSVRNSLHTSLWRSILSLLIALNLFFSSHKFGTLTCLDVTSSETSSTSFVTKACRVTLDIHQITRLMKNTDSILKRMESVKTTQIFRVKTTFQIKRTWNLPLFLGIRRKQFANIPWKKFFCVIWCASYTHLSFFLFPLVFRL